jgi:hypothetical protein
MREENLSFDKNYISEELENSIINISNVKIYSKGFFDQ